MTLTKLHHIKQAEMSEGMPDSTDQQGQLGGGPAPVVDPNSLSDGESMIALEKIYPPASTKNHTRKRLESPNKVKAEPENPPTGSGNMVSYEKFLNEADTLTGLIQTLVNENSGETLDEGINDQYKKVPRVNN